MPIRRELSTIADLESGARVIPIGSDLYRQGDICSTYFIVLSGWIALSVLLDDGSCQILDFALPGAILGFQSVPSAPMYHSARCLSVVRVRAFPRRKLDVIIETNPRLAILLCRQVTADEARAHDPPRQHWSSRRQATHCTSALGALCQGSRPSSGRVGRDYSAAAHSGPNRSGARPHLCSRLPNASGPSRARSAAPRQSHARSHRSSGSNDGRWCGTRCSQPSTAGWTTISGELSVELGTNLLVARRVDAGSE